MTIDRRSFSFAAIGLWLAPTASAQDQAQQTLIPEALDAPDEPSLTGRFSLRREGKEAVLSLAVTPTASGQDVMVKRGSRPAAAVQLFVDLVDDEVELAEVLGPVDRREVMSRMGPRPTWVAVAKGDALDLGPWRFELPREVTGVERFRVVAHVWTGEGGVELSATGIAFGGKPNV